MRTAPLITLLLLTAAFARGQQPCPYLNSATAAGVLGGEVTSQVNGDICLFTHNSSQLGIQVQTINLPYNPNCAPNPVPLNAIGNQAVACDGEGSEEVAGRVRERAFFVRLTSNSFTRAALRDKTRSVAEQVAGILY